MRKHQQIKAFSKILKHKRLNGEVEEEPVAGFMPSDSSTNKMEEEPIQGNEEGFEDEFEDEYDQEEVWVNEEDEEE